MSTVVWATEKVRDDQEYLETNKELRNVKERCSAVKQYEGLIIHNWPLINFNVAYAMLPFQPLPSPPRGFFWRACVWWGLVESSLFCELVKENKVISASGKKVWGEHDIGDYLLFVKGGFWWNSQGGQGGDKMKLFSWTKGKFGKNLKSGNKFLIEIIWQMFSLL